MLHHNMSTSNISKFTAICNKKIRNITGIEAIRFQCIPPKFPDVSPLGYCAFGLLKQARYKRYRIEDCDRAAEQNQP